MTSLMPDDDDRKAWLDYLRGDPRFTEPDVPSPRAVERTRDATAQLLRHTTTNPD